MVSCKPGRKVNNAFYYWKTVYRQNATENAFLQKLQSRRLYVRIMDVDMDDAGLNRVPVSPVSFENKLPDTIAIVPVVFIVNNALRGMSQIQLTDLARKIVHFVDGKVSQAGKSSYPELQMDCDWTAETRDNYFYLLTQLKPLLQHKTLSATLRLHQVKNLHNSGVPPVNRVMLMCYNMGNLRKYGDQNSIIELSELKKYLGDNLSSYPVKMDVGLPLFSWAVAFRDKVYIGIAKRINFGNLNAQDKFQSQGNNLYAAKTDLPEYGLKKNDVVRWESAPAADLCSAAGYLSHYIRQDTLNLIWFHLDEPVLKNYTYDELEKTGYLLR
ncbi:hypothetical protein [Mucilaginibacter sp. PPCGB 2223]|uniref:hypothetical protein n=1 Tax=Mucilaginibacter sp. PPCGB 2223 TaxID=1886027 RepID=UPI0020C7686E|nr:hypothetical protein [Mucilaginibacter sp. PPCGB 2223]